MRHHKLCSVYFILFFKRLPIPNGCPQLLSDLMQHCWNADPKNRPAFKAILQTLEQCCTSIKISENE
jgi:hypothetical protein